MQPDYRIRGESNPDLGCFYFVDKIVDKILSRMLCNCWQDRVHMHVRSWLLSVIVLS